ncbi:MAG: hypothetical protein ABJK39_13745 [Hyphomicrobiales bacterium]
MSNDRSTEMALFSLRLTIFILMIVWAALKIAAPGSYAGVGDNPGIFQKFYGVGVGGQIVLALGIAQVVFLLAYLAGLFKTITVGGVLLMNLASLVVSWDKIVFPFANPEKPTLLFVAAVPVFGASLAHFLMRKKDTFLSIGK